MFVKPSSAFVGKPSLVASSSGSAKKARYARLLPSTRKSSASRAGASFRSSSAPVRVLGDIPPSVFGRSALLDPLEVRGQLRDLHWLNPRVPRIPLLSGTRVVVASAPADARVLRPPAPGRATDVEAATKEALRFPLDGEPVGALVGRRTRATIVVEPPALPIGNVLGGPRRLAIAAVSGALGELGVRTE